MAGPQLVDIAKGPARMNRRLGWLLCISVLVLIGCGPAAVMLGAGWLIQGEIAGLVPRLAAGAAACLATIALAAAVLMPATCRAVLAHIRDTAVNRWRRR